jgi:hypothetical protein
MAPFGRDIMYTVVYLPFWHKLKIFFDFVELLKFYLLFMPKILIKSKFPTNEVK